MTGSSTTSSAWMLLLMPLALLIFSSPGHMLTLPRGTMSPLHQEFSRDLEALKICSKGFNDTQQLNITVPQVECPFPYFIAGIESMNCKSMNCESMSRNNFICYIQQHTENLVKRLKSLIHKCSVSNRSQWTITYEPLITPQKFYEKLETMLQQYNSKAEG